MRRVRIVLAEHSSGTKVEIDGQDVSDLLRAVTVNADVRHRPFVVLELAPGQVEIEGTAVLEVLEARPRPALTGHRVT